jgi:hypothetical protein
MMTAMVPVPIPQMDISTKSNIVFAGKAGNGKMVVDIALPKEHLTEIMAAFQTMQQKMMMQQQQKPWTCSMHPQVRMLQKGKCPICKMDLVPIKSPVQEKNK